MQALRFCYVFRRRYSAAVVFQVVIDSNTNIGHGLLAPIVHNYFHHLKAEHVDLIVSPISTVLLMIRVRGTYHIDQTFATRVRDWHLTL